MTSSPGAEDATDWAAFERSLGDRIQHVDGNAVAGQLAQIFRGDMTAATGRCRHCTSETVFAEARVELDTSGFILRCPSCTRVLFTVVSNDKRTWVDLQGIEGISLPS